MAASSGSSPCVVVDCGSCFLKAGWAGESAPRVVAPSVVGSVKYRRALGADSSTEGPLVGSDAMRLRGLLALRRTRNGDVVNVPDSGTLWQHALAQLRDGSRSSPAPDGPVMAVQPAGASAAAQQAVLEVLFEHGAHSKVSLPSAASTALYASGATSGVVLDVGHSGLRASPIVEGYSLEEHAVLAQGGGGSVAAAVRTLLRQQGCHLDTSAEVEVAREVGESLCECSTGSGGSDSGKFLLPDGSAIVVEQPLRTAADVLFEPALQGAEALGAHEAVCAAVARCQVDLRAALSGNVLVVGGGSLFPGFAKALLQRSAALLPAGAPLRVTASKDRFLAPWAGASVLAALDSVSAGWHTRAQYAEHGAARLARGGAAE